MSELLSQESNQEVIDVRKRNILASPKYGGSSEEDSIPYLEELGVEIVEKKQPIQFTYNLEQRVHRWAAYIQGFSADFVRSAIEEYRNRYQNLRILDPFAGCGTVLIESKLSGFQSAGTELNPLLHFIADKKVNSWDVPPRKLLATFETMPKDVVLKGPSFLKSTSHFDEKVLNNLERINGGIASLPAKGRIQRKIKELLSVAFSSILIECSRLKRTPCLGYSKSKVVNSDAPWILMDNKVNSIASDLQTIQSSFRNRISVASDVIYANAMEYKHQDAFDIAITSPPYMNGMDYVMNYKIEMGWLGFTQAHKDAKKVKDEMVVCDNVSKKLIADFVESNNSYANDWLEEIIYNIKRNIERRGAYRRPDMPYIVKKYFDDLYKVMKNVVEALNPNGRFILVIGDSLIADVYVPTDLILARIGQELGLEIEKIEKVRNRRSGQVRTYRLRETIVTLRKRAGLQ